MCSLNLLSGHAFAAVAMVACLRSLLQTIQRLFYFSRKYNVRGKYIDM